MPEKNITPQIPRFTAALGTGVISHSRLAPKPHHLKAKLMMPLLNLRRIKDDLSASRWWSAHRKNLASYCREDHFGNPDIPLEDAVKAEIAQQLNIVVDGDVFMLSNLRYFGYGFNPITLYFCSNAQGQPVACLAEVTNIPWQQKVCYAMPINNIAKRAHTLKWTHRNRKAMHVSPMLPMQMDYHWRIEYTQERLLVHIKNQALSNATDGAEAHRFHATLHLRWQPLTARNLNLALLRYPLQTVRTVMDIHWQALKLWLKGVPYIPHPHPQQQNLQSKQTVTDKTL